MGKPHTIGGVGVKWWERKSKRETSKMNHKICLFGKIRGSENQKKRKERKGKEKERKEKERKKKGGQIPGFKNRERKRKEEKGRERKRKEGKGMKRKGKERGRGRGGRKEKHTNLILCFKNTRKSTTHWMRNNQTPI